MGTAEDLIECTRELLWERGYVGTSPQAIQQRAGVGQGSMYHHFTGKPGLALAAINRTAEEMRAAAEAQFTAPGPAVERLTRYLRREREALKGCPIGRLSQDPDVMSDATLRRPVVDTLHWLRTRLADLLAEACERGEPRPGLDPVATAAAIVAVLQGSCVLARADGGGEAFAEAVDGVLALLAAYFPSA
ncbi:TetR/AcrR family transcriptional regulator [Streptomyces sp. APSN-46.1]|uniref:TetR/AcrR family transcriptional regulator n=1 Tax=Streptomyces sp. APSN-46.1 TaxID=2929049 RepID=UPI001FB30008|nr:TetR/AcrR family transcriptional regulator [Streptomyces sp. APSN-46.1]MCJ1676664.1 TetR/AcrR family transcriptional regulator [Streptomyces sp. APSN-46.1]